MLILEIYDNNIERNILITAYSKEKLLIEAFAFFNKQIEKFKRSYERDITPI